jgi:hypothetical protein
VGGDGASLLASGQLDVLLLVHNALHGGHNHSSAGTEGLQQLKING